MSKTLLSLTTKVVEADGQRAGTAAAAAPAALSDASSTAKSLPQKPHRPSQGPLKSTWHFVSNSDSASPDGKSGWKIWHKMIHYFGIDPIPPNYTSVVHNKDDPVPVFDNVQLHFWILSRTMIPLGIQWAYTQIVGNNMHPIAASLFYSIFIKAFGINMIHALRRLASKTGYLKGHASRDGIPDHSVAKVILSLMSVSTFRPMVATYLTYDPTEPVNVSPWIVLQIPVYAVAVDFWFYWYHRLMHESDLLWKYHRTHHTTKHPTAILSLYADLEQEWFDVILIPLLAFYTIKPILPLNFYEWMICWTYVMFVELFGHSGIRAYGSPPSLSYSGLDWLNMDLIIEDHDNHHSKGWKKSGNYGKQTKIWDTLFGTTMQRDEVLPENIDYSLKVRLPQY